MVLGFFDGFDIKWSGRFVLYAPAKNWVLIISLCSLTFIILASWCRWSMDVMCTQPVTVRRAEMIGCLYLAKLFLETGSKPKKLTHATTFWSQSSWCRLPCSASLVRLLLCTLIDFFGRHVDQQGWSSWRGWGHWWWWRRTLVQWGESGGHFWGVFFFLLMIVIIEINCERYIRLVFNHFQMNQICSSIFMCDFYYWYAKQSIWN